MSRPRSIALLATLALAGAGPAAASTFTWMPNAAGLNGTQFTADTLVLSDRAQIVFSNFVGNTASFTDVGIMPIIGFTLAGQGATPAGYGTSWGAYISYTGTGNQVFSQLPTGQVVPVAATYSSLTYQVVGYNGAATFSFDPDTGAAVARGGSNTTVLETGSLLSGSLQFDYAPVLTGAALNPTIIGSVQASIDEAKPQFMVGNADQFNLTFIHPAADYAFTSPVSLQITGGNQSTATVTSKQDAKTTVSQTATVGVPEPASLGMLVLALSGLGALSLWRRGRA